MKRRRPLVATSKQKRRRRELVAGAGAGELPAPVDPKNEVDPLSGRTLWQSLFAPEAVLTGKQTSKERAESAAEVYCSACGAVPGIAPRWMLMAAAGLAALIHAPMICPSCKAVDTLHARVHQPSTSRTS